MNYQILVLDLDGTLTNSRKELTEPTRKALIEIQEEGKKLSLQADALLMALPLLRKNLNFLNTADICFPLTVQELRNALPGKSFTTKHFPAKYLSLCMIL